MGEAVEANLKVRGLFDYYRWDEAKLDATEKVETEASKCRPEDRAMIAARVGARGGWGVLDLKIYTLRHSMKDMLTALLRQKNPPAVRQGSSDNPQTTNIKYNFDWKSFEYYDEDEGEYDSTDAVAWRYSTDWTRSMEKLEEIY